MYVCTYVCRSVRRKNIYIRRLAVDHEPGNEICCHLYADGRPKFVCMFGDTVHAYHDNATRKNDGLYPLLGSLSIL